MRNRSVPLWVLWFALLRSAPLFAQGSPGFIENKGQWSAAVTHRADMDGATIWFERGSVVIDLYDAEQVHSLHANVNADPAVVGPLRHHAVRLDLFGRSAIVDVIASGELTGEHNYFIGSDPKQWAAGSRSFSTISMTDVAPGCDAVFRHGRGGLKYDLVLAPGADPAAIRLTYQGATSIALRDDALVVETSLGRLIERIPLAYQDIGGERRIVTCHYSLDGNVIGIIPEGYDRSHELVIDPQLEFATFSGSVSNNFGYTATFDNAGFLYAGSTAFGNAYPITMGAYQTTWAGGETDIAITKYDTTGSYLIWSTYLGGSNSEMPHSLIVDENDRLVLLGTTGSSDFPTTETAFDRSFGGGTSFNPNGLGLTYPQGSDMVVARLDQSGSVLLGSTYLGGSLNDGLNSAAGLRFNYADEVRGEVLLDTNAIWIVSTTQSTNMPLTANAAQGSFAGGTHDGYVARFDPTLSQLEYASYLGGTLADALYAGAVDQQGRLFVTGGTSSTDLPVSADAADPTFNGGPADAFVARFSSDGTSIEELSYHGSTAYDQAYFVELDGAGSVYLFGQTAAPAGELIFNSLYFINSGGQFITKLDAGLSTILLNSRIGIGDGDPDISPTAFLVDVCDKIYTSGWGSSTPGLGGNLTTTGLPVTSDAHQSTTTGHDLYLAVFEINMSELTYATYYGGPISAEHVDGGTSRFDRRGRVYQSVCAGCQNNDDFPTTPGAWSSTNNSSGCNNGVLKFDFDAPLVIAAFLAPDTACANGPVQFMNLSSGGTYSWDLGDETTSTETSPTHIYPSTGTYTVTLTVSDPNSCNGSDSISRTIVIADPRPILTVMNDTLICGPIDSFELLAESNGTAAEFIWSSSPQFTDMLNAGLQDSTATIAPAIGGWFYIQAASGPACKAIDSVEVVVQLATPSLAGDSLNCSGDTATLSLSGVGEGDLIIWQPADEIVNGQGTTIVQVVPLDDLVFGVTVETDEGCEWTGSIAVQVSSLLGPSVAATADQQVVVPGTTVQLNAFPAGSFNYSWSPAALLSDPSIASPTAVVNEATTFTVSVSDGVCTRDASVIVTVHELVCDEPDIFVPNTFTPNGDGNNDLLFVRGRHITEMEFQVFDRWGEKVFETHDITIGWDGSFKGMKVDPAVFVYHLNAKCVDGQRYFTKGNVSVVR